MMKRSVIYLCFAFVMTNSMAQECIPGVFEGPAIFDTYHEFFDNPTRWNVFNVHDPTVWKDGDWYYMYNTDVGMGYDPGTGALKRRSQDIINWEFLGQAFEGLPDSARNFFLQYNPDYTDNGIWAPFLIRHKDQYRLYYAAPGGLDGVNLAFIGWAVSSSAEGPWEDQGGIASSTPGDTINAIDPTVVIDHETGQHWMAYGSYETGLYIVELDSLTGGLKTPGDRGVRIAARGGGRHAAIEGPEINYRNGWYYLFVSYDWLEDYYNVRVGRSENPWGPYYDIQGNDMADYTSNEPVILKPYRFNHHEGWQGTGHCSVYNDEGQFYMFHQGRPRTDIYNMVLHARKIFWIDDWPVVSPERYAGVPVCDVPPDSMVGAWEQIELDYVVGILLTGSETIELDAEGSINGDSRNSWNLQDSLLTLSWNEGETVYKTIVSWGWDWENRCLTLLFTGMDSTGMNIWGKKIDERAVSKHTELISGAAYTIRSHYSNMLIEVPDGKDEVGATIRQGKDNNELYQVWRIVQHDDGDWSLVAEHSADDKVIEVPEGDPAATFLKLGAFTAEEKQKFALNYKGDGYFKILTRISNYEKCFDLYNFSIQEGGFISQWEDLNGVNQAWKFSRIDSLGIDHSLGAEFLPDGFVDAYPNPFTDKIFFSVWNGSGPYRIELINPLGQIVYACMMDPGSPAVVEIPANLRDQIYFLRMHTRQGVMIKTMYKQGINP